jgi:hypothetical protein
MLRLCLRLRQLMTATPDAPAQAPERNGGVRGGHPDHALAEPLPAARPLRDHGTMRSALI